MPHEAGGAVVVLADDHRVVRSGLRLLLQGEPGIHVVGVVGDAEAALRMVEARKPDVLVLDLNMPGRPSLDAIPDVPARTRIVEGAVSMVEMALAELGKRGVVDLDNERRAAMVSNLLVVLCGDRSTQPVVNTGTLY